MKLTEDKPFQLKQVKGTIIDTKNQISWNFTEKNIIHIELEQGNKRLFYEVNDEFKQNQKLRELIENFYTIDLRLMIAESSGDKRIVNIANKIQKLLEETKK